MTDGLQGNEFNGNATFKSNSGELFFGGINGLNAFYPEEINKVNKDTIVNYIFSKLNENKLLSVNNTNYIINKLKQLITL